MKILFTSDTHGSELAVAKFVKILQEPSYACGVIAGDISDDHLGYCDVVDLLGLSMDDVIEDLPGVDDPPLPARILIDMNDLNTRNHALRAREARLRTILYRTNKPIFIVKGNHDITEWASGRNIHNIHWKQVKFRGYNFVGYQHTEFDRTLSQQRRDCQVLSRSINSKTILVTHIPAYGVLDGTSSGGLFGSKALSTLIETAKPRLHLHGHIHQSRGKAVRSINGSWCGHKTFWGVDLDTTKVWSVDVFPIEEPEIERARRLNQPAHDFHKLLTNSR